MQLVFKQNDSNIKVTDVENFDLFEDVLTVKYKDGHNEKFENADHVSIIFDPV